MVEMPSKQDRIRLLGIVLILVALAIIIAMNLIQPQPAGENREGADQEPEGGFSENRPFRTQSSYWTQTQGSGVSLDARRLHPWATFGSGRPFRALGNLGPDFLHVGQRLRKDSDSLIRHPYRGLGAGFPLFRASRAWLSKHSIEP